MAEWHTLHTQICLEYSLNARHLENFSYVSVLNFRLQLQEGNFSIKFIVNELCMLLIYLTRGTQVFVIADKLFDDVILALLGVDFSNELGVTRSKVKHFIVSFANV